ncbi:MAG TPA: hypothetical protein VJB05_03845 [archaeon]|nr:hypothetical protein [archaeon]
MKPMFCPECRKPITESHRNKGFYCRGCKTNMKIKSCPRCRKRMKQVKFPYGVGWRCDCSKYIWFIFKSHGGTLATTGILKWADW